LLPADTPSDAVQCANRSIARWVEEDECGIMAAEEVLKALESLVSLFFSSSSFFPLFLYMRIAFTACCWFEEE
jgi:hypothetical protein